MQVSAAEKTLTILGYLPLVSAVILLLRVRRDSIFVQFHVRQAWVLFLLLLAADLVLFILLFVLPFAYGFLLGVMFLTWGIYGVLMLAGMVKSGLGERYRMPVVADVALMMRL